MIACLKINQIYLSYSEWYYLLSIHISLTVETVHFLYAFLYTYVLYIHTFTVMLYKQKYINHILRYKWCINIHICMCICKHGILTVHLIKTQHDRGVRAEKLINWVRVTFQYAYFIMVRVHKCQKGCWRNFYQCWWWKFKSLISTWKEDFRQSSQASWLQCVKYLVWPTVPQSTFVHGWGLFEAQATQTLKIDSSY